jgi:NAD(P)-dependent dehydrogenase (short-subunit alcohol dehydrogenase family)
MPFLSRERQRGDRILSGSPSLIDSAGRVAVVTGAAGGIGGACVEMLLAAGANVCALDQKTIARADHPQFMKRVLDVRREDAVREALQAAHARFGDVDCVIHAAGMVGKGRLDALGLADWHTVMDTNLTSAFLMLKHAYPLLRKPGGAVVLFGSSNGTNGGSYLSGAAYAAAKAAVINLARYCAKEWAPDGVRVNAISPGPVDTPMLDRLSAAQHDSLKAALPLGHYATAQECAATALFLCSGHAGSMTGTNTNISSGMVL